MSTAPGPDDLPDPVRVEPAPTRFAGRIARGAMWSLIGTFVFRGFVLLASVGVARLVGKSAFGEFGIIQSLLGMLQAFAGLGLGVTATKYVAELRQSDAARAGRIVGLTIATAGILGLVLAAVLVVLAPYLATHVLAAPHIANAIRLGALGLAFSVIAGAQTGALAGFEAFRQIAWVNVITGATSFPLMLAGAALAGVDGVVLGSALAMLLNCLCNSVALARAATAAGVTIQYRRSSAELSVLLRFSLPAMLWSILLPTVTWVTNTLLVNTQTGYDEMGIFTAANQWRMAVSYVPIAIGTSLLPVLSSLAGQQRWPELRRLVRANVAVTTGVALAMALPIALLAPVLMLGYGHGFADGELVVLVLMIVAVIAAPPVIINRAIVSLEQMWSGALLNLIWAVSLVVAAVYLVDRGALGLAVAYLVAYAIHLLLSALYAYLRLSRLDGSPTIP